MKAQFYIVGALMLMMYLIFFTQVFTSMQTEEEIPDVFSPQNIFSVFQQIADEGGNTEKAVEVFFDALKFSAQPYFVSCTSYATGEGVCILPEAHWKCGVNVTASAGTRSYATLTELIQSRSGFVINSPRMPVFVKGNTTANLVKISVSVTGLVSTPAVVDGGEIIKATCSGGQCTFRTNIREEPRAVYIYNSTNPSQHLFEDIGVLNDTGYDGSAIISILSKYWSYDVLKLDELEDVTGQAGPVILFLPSQYPQKYSSYLLEYVEEGGTLVAPYGLCDPETFECLVGRIESPGTSTLTNYSGFPVDLSTTSSSYFTKADIPWAVWNTNDVNASRAGIGVIKYGEGYVIFVGNESMLHTWDRLEEFINYTVSWAVPPG